MDGLRFNQPAGHLEPNESLVEGSARETLEETANPFSPNFLIGIYQWSRPDGEITYLRFAFGGEVGECVGGQALDAGIVRAVWLTPEEIAACRSRHRSPLVMQCVEDYLSGRRAPLELLRHYDT